MNTSTLERLAPLLAALRGHAALVEVRPTVFHLNGRDFVHFHDDAPGLVADVRLARGQVRLPAATPADQADVLDKVDEALGALEPPTRGRRLRKRDARDGDD